LVRERRIFRDIFYLAIDTFRANCARFLLTSLGGVLRLTSDYLEDRCYAPVSSDSCPAAVIGVD
jgi:hypothetical protein